MDTKPAICEQFEIKVTAQCNIRDCGHNGVRVLVVWIDDELFDGITPPAAALEQVKALIREHGRSWAEYAPEEWSDDFDDHGRWSVE